MGGGFRCHERLPHDPPGAAIHCRLCGANEGQCKAPCGCLCATKEPGAAFCTCGIYPTDPLSVPAPRTAWRHSLSCAHSQVRRTHE